MPTNLTDILFPEQQTPAHWRERLHLDALEREQGLPAGLLTAIIPHESGGNPGVVSRAGARGLFQLMPETAAAYKVDPDDPTEAAVGAAMELGKLTKKYRGHLPSVLAAWNWGQGNYDQYGMGQVPEETRAFQSAVMTTLGRGPKQAAQPRSLNLTDELFGTAPAAAPASPALPPAVPGLQPSADAAPAAAQPEGSVVAVIEQPPTQRQVDPRTMDDDALLRHIGANPTLVKQSKLYRPGNFQKLLLEPGSTLEGIMRSRAGDILEGFSSAPLGALQLGARGTEALGLTSPADTAYIDAMIKLRRTEYAQSPRPSVHIPVLGPVNPVEAVGSALFPVPGARGVLAMQPGASFLANTGRGLVNAAVGGAEAGLLQPVYDPGTTYGQQKVGQVGGGAVVGTAFGAVPAVAGAALGVNRAARAVEKAQAATAEDVATYAQQQAERARASQAAASKAETTAAERTAQRQAGYEARVAMAEEKARTATEQQHADWLQQMQAHRQNLEGELLQRQDRMNTAQRVVDEANAEAQTAYQTGSREAYQAAVEKMRTLERDRQVAVRDYDTAVQAHKAVAEQLQALPEQYAPQMPARTMADVMRDLRTLDQEGAPREAVLRRLGAQNVEDAGRMLTDEGQTYMQAGQSMPGRPGEAVAPSFRQPALPPTPAVTQGPELQKAIRDNGKIRLAGEAELKSDFGSYITQKEVGRDKALLNNKSGLTPEQMAEKLQEQGFDIADKDALLANLRESMAGRPVYPKTATLEAPAFPAAAAVPERVPDMGGGKVSSQLYARFDEAGARTPVDFTLAKNAVAEVRDQLGMVPPSGQPTIIQKIAKDIDDMGAQGNASQGYEIMKSLGKALRSADGKTRYLAQQIFEGVTNAMEESAPPELLTMLQQAKTAWKAEQGVNVLHELFGKRPGILKENQAGQMVVNIAALRNSVKNKRMADELTKWLGPEEYARLVDDVNAVPAPPAIPRQVPARSPEAAPLPGLVDVSQIPERPIPQTIWDLPASERRALRPVTIEDLPQMPRPVTPPDVGPPPLPVEPGPVAATPWSPPPVPHEPELLPPWQQFWRREQLARPEHLIPFAGMMAGGKGVIPAVIAGAIVDLTSYGLAHVLLSREARPLLQAIMANGGVISPEIAARLGYIGGVASHRPERAVERGQQVDTMQRRVREQLQRGGR